MLLSASGSLSGLDRKLTAFGNKLTISCWTGRSEDPIVPGVSPLLLFEISGPFVLVSAVCFAGQSVVRLGHGLIGLGHALLGLLRDWREYRRGN